MPKSRHVSKSRNMLKKQMRREERKSAFQQAARIANLAKNIDTQDKLNAMLLPVDDADRRKKLFEFVKQYLPKSFINPECPSPLALGSVIVKP